MTKKELFKMLEGVPEDAQIVVQGTSCDIMGDYSYSPDFTVRETIAYGPSLDMAISNYVNTEDPKTVWVIE